jgi:plastocyanin
MKLNMTLIAPVLLAAAAVAQAGTPDEAYWAPPGETNMPSPPAPAATPQVAPRLAVAPASAPATPALPADRAVNAPPTATNTTIVAVAAPEASVNIKDFAFAPTATTVTVGTTVHWKNLDGEPHTVRSIDATFRSDPLDQNDSYSVKFDKPGTYKYACSIHPQMVGTIVVKAAN